jgi:hypothetical protein
MMAECVAYCVLRKGTLRCLENYSQELMEIA